MSNKEQKASGMNSTWKTILQIVSYVITAILGAFGGNAVM